MAILPSKNQKEGDRFLIAVTVLGSAGPIRFVVSDGERVSDVIETVLKAYAREGRRPILGSDRSEFVLYCSYGGSEVLDHWNTMSSKGTRSFVLCKKQQMAFPSAVADVGKLQEEAAAVLPTNEGGGVWKTWFNSLKVSSH